MLNKNLEVIWQKNTPDSFLGCEFIEDKNLYVYNKYYDIGFINQELGISCLDLETGKYKWDYTLPINYKTSYC